METNPYAPPAVLEQPKPEPDKWEQGRVFRDGPHMVVYHGAELPERCFVTGEDTQTSAPVNQVWQPEWLPWLLLLGVIPYFLVSPFVNRRIDIQVPIAPPVMQRHRRLVVRGFLLLLTSGLIFLIWLMLLSAEPWTNAFLLASIVLGVLGFFIASRQPVRLDVVTFPGSYVVLRGVHPRCMQVVPELSSMADLETNVDDARPS